MDAVAAALGDQVERMRGARGAISGVEFYPHDILGNVVHLNSMLTGELRDLDAMAGGRPVADIGAADGDLAFMLEDVCGWEMDIIDTAATNHNGLRGAKALREQLGSGASIHDIDLDRQFALPRQRYGLVLVLGLLYHLQNPFFLLRSVAEHADHCLLSTRVARLMGPEGTHVSHIPVAYLVKPDELNADPTNYWVLSQAGLERLVERAGWEVQAMMNVGDTTGSDTFSAEHDERCFMLLRSDG